MVAAALASTQAPTAAASEPASPSLKHGRLPSRGRAWGSTAEPNGESAPTRAQTMNTFRTQWPSITHVPTGRSESQQAFMFLGPPKDRLAFTCGAGTVTAASVAAEAKKRRDTVGPFANNHQDGTTSATFARRIADTRLYMRNVSSSVLQLQRHRCTAAAARTATPQTPTPKRRPPASVSEPTAAIVAAVHAGFLPCGGASLANVPTVRPDTASDPGNNSGGGGSYPSGWPPPAPASNSCPRPTTAGARMAATGATTSTMLGSTSRHEQARLTGDKRWEGEAWVSSGSPEMANAIASFGVGIQPAGDISGGSSRKRMGNHGNTRTPSASLPPAMIRDPLLPHMEDSLQQELLMCSRRW